MKQFGIVFGLLLCAAYVQAAGPTPTASPTVTPTPTPIVSPTQQLTPDMNMSSVGVGQSGYVIKIAQKVIPNKTGQVVGLAFYLGKSLNINALGQLQYSIVPVLTDGSGNPSAMPLAVANCAPTFIPTPAPTLTPFYLALTAPANVVAGIPYYVQLSFTASANGFLTVYRNPVNWAGVQGVGKIYLDDNLGWSRSGADFPYDIQYGVVATITPTPNVIQTTVAARQTEIAGYRIAYQQTQVAAQIAQQTAIAQMTPGPNYY